MAVPLAPHTSAVTSLSPAHETPCGCIQTAHQCVEAWKPCNKVSVTVKTEKRSLDINRVQELKTFALSSVQQGDHDFTVSLAACKHYRHQQQNS